MLRFFVLFLVLLAMLFALELTPWAQAYVVVPWTNALARLLKPEVTVRHSVPGAAAPGPGTAPSI